MERPYRCCNPLCTSTFDSIANLHRHARLSRKCAAYWDLRCAANLLSGSLNTKNDTKPAAINEPALQTQIQVLPSVMLQNNDDNNDVGDNDMGRKVAAPYAQRMQTEETNVHRLDSSTNTLSTDTSTEPTVTIQSPLLHVPTDQNLQQQSAAVIRNVENELPTMFTTEQKSIVQLM